MTHTSGHHTKLIDKSAATGGSGDKQRALRPRERTRSWDAEVGEMEPLPAVTRPQGGGGGTEMEPGTEVTAGAEVKARKVRRLRFHQWMVALYPQVLCLRKDYFAGCSVTIKRGVSCLYRAGRENRSISSVRGDWQLAQTTCFPGNMPLHELRFQLPRRPVPGRAE